jgi:hypothetical protein
MSELNRLPISPLTSFGPYSVQNGKPFGTNFSIYGIGGFMEVYSLSDLLYTIPMGMTGNIEYSGNTIPIQFTKGNGSIFSPDVLTLNSDNISSGRRKLGMLVYVYEQNQIYQFNINNYTTLWNSATGATGIGGPTVVISNFGTTIKNNSVAGQNLINSWTANTIEGVSGETSTTAVWKKLVTGGGNQGGGISAFTYSSNTFTILDVSGTPYSATINYVTGLTVNGNITITGNTNVNNLTGNTISATTFSGSGIGLNNIPISGVTNLQSELNNKFDKTGGTVNGSVVVTGNVTILGTATTINTDTLSVKDNIISINSNYSGNTAPFFGNSGIEVLRGSATTATLLWEESKGYWTAGLTGNTKQIIVSGNSLSLLNSGHTHPISEIVNLQSNLNNKLETSGGTISGSLNVTNSLTATTFYGDGSNLTGISKGGGGGGQLYYFNISRTQSPYYEFSTSATSTSEQSITVSTGSTQTAYIGGFMTPSNLPNVTTLPTGIISFYIHAYTDNSNTTFNLYCELYKRTTGGTETLLLTSDPVVTIGTTPTMYITDAFFSGTSLNTTDRLVVKVYATNTSSNTRSITMLSEGTEHYSFSYTTIPTFTDTYVTGFTYSNNTLTIKQNNNQPDYTQTINQVTGLTINGNLNVTGNTTLNSLSANTISATTFTGGGSGLTNIPISGVTNLQSSLDSKFDKSGGTISGNTIFTSGITASTISATTYFNLPISGLTGGNNIGVTNNNSNYRISFIGGVVTATTIFNNGLTSNTLNVTGVTILDGTTISTLNVTGNTILSGITASTLNVTGDTILNSLTATTISATTYLNTPYFVSGSSGTYSLKVRNDKLNDSTGDYAFSINAGTRAEGIASFALGSGTTAQETASFAGGINSLAYGKGTFVFGTNSTAFADGTIVLGTSQYGTIPDMTYSQKMSVSGSGTSYPIFNVKGSNGSLFSVYDSVTGTLFSVNNISGLPVFEVLDSDSIKIGTQAISKFSTKTISLTAGTNIVFLIPTSTYTSSFFDYSLSGSSGMRAGNVMSIWSGTTTQYTETSTNDIGNTSGVTFSVDVSGSNARFIASAITSGWTVSTIIKSI